jgi:tetratricopeptide (TPR) repeat protein
MTDRIRVLDRQALLDRIAKCRQILEANPSSQIFAALAEAYRKMGDLKSALDVCHDGIERHPNYGSAYLVLAKVARDQKRFDEAEKAAKRGIELEGTTRSAELLLSDIYIQTGKFAAAEEILVRLATADPSNQPVQKLLNLARRASKARTVENLSPGPAANRTAPGGTKPGLADAQSGSNVEEPRASTGAAPDSPQESWTALFETLGRYPRLLGKIAVSYDGMLLETDIEIRSEAEAAAAMTAKMYSSVHDDWPQSTFGTLEQMLVETEQATWWLWPFPQFLLVLWCEPTLNMGPLRMRIAQFDAVSALSTSGGIR